MGLFCMMCGPMSTSMCYYQALIIVRGLKVTLLTRKPHSYVRMSKPEALCCVLSIGRCTGYHVGAWLWLVCHPSHCSVRRVLTRVLQRILIDLVPRPPLVLTG
jgi:hypothetical protein